MIADSQLASFAERLVQSLDRIARALEGVDETYKRQFQKAYPARSQVREAVITRVPSHEDRIREAQGATVQSLSQWLSDIEQEEEEGEFVGVREKEWLKGHPVNPLQPERGTDQG